MQLNMQFNMRRTMRCASHAPRVYIRLWRGSVLATLLIAGSARRSAAQFGALFGAVQVAPASLALTDTAPTATFTLRNTSGQPASVWLGPACDAVHDSADQGDPIADAWRNHSSCAVPWLSGYPQHVVLAPQEQRTVTMRVIPSPTLPDGHYTARLIWALALANVTPAGDTTGRGVEHDELAITYDKGPQSPRPARTQWRTTLPAGQHIAAVSHSPAVLVLDDHQRSATFTLTNPAATPTEVWLAVDCPWFHVNFINYPDSHQYESAWHGRMPSAAFWLSGYPQHLTLAPHERRTITLSAFPDIRAGKQPAGSYYARLVYVQSPVLAVTPSGDTTYATPQGAMDVVYHRGAAQHLSLGPLQRTTRPDGTAQACMTVQQPGLGVVAQVHAEIDDASGHPVGVHVGTGGGVSPVWALDTTVAVWEVMHHDPMDASQDGTPVPPEPVCFTLPKFPPGHNHLVASVAALGDTAKSQRMQEALSLEPR